jgi:phosphatidate cytidylyltransferase
MIPGFTHLTFNTQIALMSLFGLLFFSQGVVWLLKRIKPQANFTEVQIRIRSWWIIIILLTLSFMGSHKVTIAFWGFISFLALKEYFSIIPTRRADRRILFWVYLAIPFQYYWIMTEWYGMFIIFIPVYLFLFIPYRMVAIGETKGFLKAVGTIFWGVMCTVFSISHLAYLTVLPVENNPAGGRIGLILFLLFLTEINDVAQFCWGKTLGRHAVAPTVSPKKTVEGAVGGILTTTGISFLLAPYLSPLSYPQSLYIGATIGFCGFIGDVVISAVKRDLGIKDSGTLIPGHGGILDRIDSLTYTAPIFFHILYYLKY